MSQNPFISITVQPTYGKRSALVRWQLPPQYRDEGILVGRSVNGGASYKLLNAGDAPIFGTNEFLDADVPVTSRLTDLYYKLSVELTDTGDMLDSPPISPLGDMTAKELAIAGRIIFNEYENLRHGNGIRVLHFAPKTSGEINPDFDPDIWATRATECGAAEKSYGLRFKGGYADPLPTWIYFGEQKLEQQETAESAAITQQRIAPGRMLCYPRPCIDHLIVNPMNDERWGIGPVVTPYLFRGVIAIAYDVTLHLLDRRDPRYSLDVSPWLNAWDNMDRSK